MSLSILQIAINNLTRLYSGHRDREQRDAHFRARLVFEQGLHTQANKSREDSERRARLLENYPLADIGALARMLPDDGLPAILVSDPFMNTPGVGNLSVRAHLTGLLAEVESAQGCIHECSGALTMTSSGLLSPITGKLQALDICANEFYNRPAIVIYHEGDEHALHSYVLLWNFFLDRRGITWDRVRLCDVDMDQTQVTRSGVALSPPHTLSPEAEMGGRQEQIRKGHVLAKVVAQTGFAAVMAILDAHRYLSEELHPSLFRYVQDLPDAESYQNTYVRFLNRMGRLASRERGQVHALSPFLAWLESEFRLIHDAGYPMKAEELPGGNVALLVGQQRKGHVALWISRKFREVPPKVFWYDGIRYTHYAISTEDWVAALENMHLAEIVEKIITDASGG